MPIKRKMSAYLISSRLQRSFVSNLIEQISSQIATDDTGDNFWSLI